AGPRARARSHGWSRSANVRSPYRANRWRADDRARGGSRLERRRRPRSDRAPTRRVVPTHRETAATERRRPRRHRADGRVVRRVLAPTRRAHLAVRGRGSFRVDRMRSSELQTCTPPYANAIFLRPGDVTLAPCLL